MPCLKVSLESDAPIGMHVTAHVRIVRGGGDKEDSDDVWRAWLAPFALRRRCSCRRRAHMFSRLIGVTSLRTTTPHQLYRYAAVL
jgi:hypothetical protein